MGILMIGERVLKKRRTQYEIGYLNGQLDAAENELYYLYEIKEQMGNEAHETDAINSRIRDTEKFLLENGRKINT